MRKEIVSAEIFAHFDEMEIAPWFLAGATCAGFTVADDVLCWRHETGLRQRAQRENHAGRVAPGIGDKLRSRDAVRVESGRPYTASPRCASCGAGSLYQEVNVSAEEKRNAPLKSITRKPASSNLGPISAETSWGVARKAVPANLP